MTMKPACCAYLFVATCAMSCLSGDCASVPKGSEVGVDVVWGSKAPDSALESIVGNRHDLSATAGRGVLEFRWIGNARWTTIGSSGGSLIIAYVTEIVWGKPPRIIFYGWIASYGAKDSLRHVLEFEVEDVRESDIRTICASKSFVVSVRTSLGGWEDVIRVPLP